MSTTHATGASGDSSEAPLALMLYAALFVAGAGTMAVELAAVRLLAPWFGAATVVWTNVIGVILLALALGYLLGARLSRDGEPARRLAWVLSLASATTAVLPLLAPTIAELFLPAALSLDEAAALLGWGSLASSLCLFLPPALFLGCVGPLAVEWLVRARRGHAGDAGGRVLAASTLGSLVGTFGTTHLAVPVLGLQRTFLCAALALALAGLPFWRDARRRAAAAALLLAVGIGAALVRPGQPDLMEGWRLLEARESPYQAVRVVELPAEEGAARGLRFLQINECFDSFQSVGAPDSGLLPPGYYYDFFAPPAWWQHTEDAGAARPEWRVLTLGLGAGSAVRVLQGCLPEGTRLASTGIELDPVVVALGERWFDLETDRPDRRVLADLDARAALRAVPVAGADEGFDQVVLDCYANAVEVPPHLSTVEFFREVAACVRPGGWITLNAAGFGLDDPVVRALAESLAAGIEDRVLSLRVPFSRNCLLVARRGAGTPEPGTAAWRVAHPELASLLAMAELPGAWEWVAPRADATLLTDDVNPIPLLQVRSIAEGRRKWLPQ